MQIEEYLQSNDFPTVQIGFQLLINREDLSIQEKIDILESNGIVEDIIGPLEDNEMGQWYFNEGWFSCDTIGIFRTDN